MDKDNCKSGEPSNSTSSCSLILSLKSSDIKSYKFVTDDYWAVTGMIPSQEMNWGFSDSCRITDNIYVEYFLVHPNQEKLKDSVVYSYELDNDIWEISSKTINEIWKRVE